MHNLSELGKTYVCRVCFAILVAQPFSFGKVQFFMRGYQPKCGLSAECINRVCCK